MEPLSFQLHHFCMCEFFEQLLIDFYTYVFGFEGGMRDLIQGEEPTSRSRANNNKYLMYQKKIISDQIRNLAVPRNLRVRYLFCKAQLIRTNAVCLYQVLSFDYIKLFTRALRKTDIMVSVPKCPRK